MYTNEESLILIHLNLLNQLKISEINTKDKNTSYELKNLIHNQIKKLERLGAKVRFLEGYFSLIDYHPTLICKL